MIKLKLCFTAVVEDLEKYADLRAASLEDTYRILTGIFFTVLNLFDKKINVNLI